MFGIKGSIGVATPPQLKMPDLISQQPYKTVMYRNNKRTTTTPERCIIRSWKGEHPENKNEIKNTERK